MRTSRLREYRKTAARHTLIDHGWPGWRLADREDKQTDTDSDGLPDVWEVHWGYEPLSIDKVHDKDGDGVNADNIRKCLEILRDNDYDGALSMECEGEAGPMIEKSSSPDFSLLLLNAVPACGDNKG